MHIIRRNNCIYATLGICHSVRNTGVHAAYQTVIHKYQVSHRYNYFSWWWEHSRLKHVEKRNKHTKKSCASSWLYLQNYFRDAQSTKHKWPQKSVIVQLLQFQSLNPYFTENTKRRHYKYQPAGAVLEKKNSFLLCEACKYTLRTNCGVTKLESRWWAPVITILFQIIDVFNADSFEKAAFSALDTVTGRHTK